MARGQGHERALCLGVSLSLALAVGCAGRSVHHDSDHSASGGAGAETSSGGSPSSGGSFGSGGTIDGTSGGASGGGAGGSSGNPGGICAMGRYEASRPTQSRYVLLDRSDALGEGDRFNRAFETLMVLFARPELAGSGMAFGIFPNADGALVCDDGSCDAEACGTPLVDFGQLTEQGNPQDTQEARLTNALADVTPSKLGPPLPPALEGALSWAERRRLENPVESPQVLLVSTGALDACPPVDIDRVRSAHDDFGIFTWVIGFQDSDRTLLDEIALAGGTSHTYVLGPDPELNASELSALTTNGTGNVVACDFPLPDANPELVDPDNVLVSIEKDGVSVPLLQIPDERQCGGELGWYYVTGPDAPELKRIALCPASCAAIVSGGYDALEVLMACSGVPPL